MHSPDGTPETVQPVLPAPQWPPGRSYIMKYNMVEDHRHNIEQDPRWARIAARDRSADGTFWYSVITTGVYCRPSCPSRRANPRNVNLHNTLQEAQKTGFRACKRCNPNAASPNAASVAQACRLIEQSEPPPALTDLAKQLGLSPGHLHRRFKAATGLTPKQYAKARQAGALRQQLTPERTVTEAIYDAGFVSTGRFYAQAAGILGMTPTQYRDGGTGEELKFAIGQASLGAILVACSPTGVAAILLGDDPEILIQDLQDRFPKAHLIGADADYEAQVAKIVGFVEAPKLGLELPLDIRGTAFQQRVWQALRQIPAGQTATYTDIARAIGAPTAARAVAGACAANPIAVAIPCHRVVRTNGALSGYRWGIERKRELIKREA